MSSAGLTQTVATGPTGEPILPRSASTVPLPDRFLLSKAYIYPRFKTKTNIFSKDCLDSCLQDPQCNYALVDLGAGLCWKIENPLGFKSDEPGFVAYQCGFGLSEWYTHAILILSFCLNFLLQSRLRRFLFDSAKFISAPTKVRPRLATNTLA